jgi:hypothetical protein
MTDARADNPRLGWIVRPLSVLRSRLKQAMGRARTNALETSRTP